MRVIILGAKGMAGHMISLYFKENSDWEIIPLSRDEFNVEKDWESALLKLNIQKKVDCIINAIGVLKNDSNSNPIRAIKVNSLFPHELAKFCTLQKIKLIHLSTDCWNDLDVYGRSKRAGELNYPEHLTLRTSIIGPELKNGSGLFNWFMMQNEKVKGFTKHYWDGVTTLELAIKIHEILSKNLPLSNIQNFRTEKKISKFELLKHIKEIFGKQVKIESVNTEVVDKTCNNAEISCQKTLLAQIKELKTWMIGHKQDYSIYSKYLI